VKKKYTGIASLFYIGFFYIRIMREGAWGIDAYVYKKHNPGLSTFT
jgi:hypothetical protein